MRHRWLIMVTLIACRLCGTKVTLPPMSITCLLQHHIFIKKNENTIALLSLLVFFNFDFFFAFVLFTCFFDKHLQNDASIVWKKQNSINPDVHHLFFAQTKDADQRNRPVFTAKVCKNWCQESYVVFHWFVT